MWLGLLSLHLGSLRSYQGRDEEALRLWESAGAATADPSVRYLALLFRSRTEWTQGRPDAAVDTLSKALEIAPGAQSGQVLLSALLYLHNQRSQAELLVARLLAAPETDDPWWSYLRGEYEQWPERLRIVRAGLK